MNLDALSDEELMVMYQKGSEEAFKILYRRHSEKIYGFLRSRVWNNERASELYQEVFLKIHKSKHLYNKSLPALPWIFSVTKSVLVDGLRVDKKASRDSEYTAPTESPDERSVKDIATLLARLPENQRNAVELRYMDEKTFEQIAESLNTSSQNARKIVSRAVAKLKNLVNGSGEKP
jgi:RNA polymerase sigma-70 factor (ECF subfamily)